MMQDFVAESAQQKEMIKAYVGLNQPKEAVGLCERRVEQMQNLSEELIEKATLIEDLVQNMKMIIAFNLHTPANPERLLKCTQDTYDECFLADVAKLKEALARDKQAWQASLDEAHKRSKQVAENYDAFLAQQQ